MISILIYVLIVIIIFGAIFYALRSWAPLEQPFLNIAYLILLILFIVILLGVIGLIPGMPIRPLM